MSILRRKLRTTIADAHVFDAQDPQFIHRLQSPELLRLNAHLPGQPQKRTVQDRLVHRQGAHEGVLLINVSDDFLEFGIIDLTAVDERSSADISTFPLAREDIEEG